MIRTRFAPSPTGSLHIGGLRTAMFNAMYAKKHGGTFVLRVEDTNQSKLKDSGIIEGLTWAGIVPDEGAYISENSNIYFQNNRGHIYKEYLDILISKDLAYKKDGITRFRASSFGKISFTDMIGGKQSLDFENLQKQPGASDDWSADFPIQREDGTFLFNFANVVDDIDMNITHVIRGEDHLSNTVRHIALFKAFDKTPPVFAHIPLILNPDGSKMSKSTNGAAVDFYSANKYIPGALKNYLSAMSWVPKTAVKDIFDVFDAKTLNEFDLNKISPRNAKYDQVKLNAINGSYIRKMSDSDYLEWSAETQFTKSVLLTRGKVKTHSEIKGWLKPLYENCGISNNADVSDITDWSVDGIKNTLTTWAAGDKDKLSLRVRDLQMSLTGSNASISIYNIMAELGETEVKSRLTELKVPDFQKSQNDITQTL